MPFEHTLNLAGSTDAGDIHTVIFVDVDGVLNIGARDDAGGAPLLFSNENLDQARRLHQGGGRNAKHECVRKLLSISERSLGPGEESTLTALAACPRSSVSSVLAGRLAELIRAAGASRTVVLSSSWRKPQHRLRAQRLEQEISHHLGESFAFDERTPLRNDSSAQERLRCIGDFLEGMQLPTGGRLRLLVLEDFFVTPLGGWSCDGVEVRSTEAAEQYLLGRLPSAAAAAAAATARVVHTYDEWATPDGLRVQVGVGLTTEHFTKAMDFLASGLPEDAQLEEGDTSNVSELVATKPAKENSILCGRKAQEHWLDRLSASLPWLPVAAL